MEAPVMETEELYQIGVLRSSEREERRLAYEICAELFDLTESDYLTVRDLALLSGIREDVSLEIALLALFAALREGSLCLKLDENSVVRLFPGNGDFISRHFREFHSNLLTGRYSALAGEEREGEIPYLPLIRKGDFLYFHKYRVAITKIKRALETLASPETPPIEANPIDSNILGSLPFQLDSGQMEVLEKGLRNRFLIITGGPGTGKTSILFALLKHLESQTLSWKDIALAAPTGKAAQRMTDIIRAMNNAFPEKSDTLSKLEGKTIHRLLEYIPSLGIYRRNASSPLKCKLVILDEVSMIDVALMADFLEAIPRDCRVIFLGDPDQLPSVGAGAVLTDLLPSSRMEGALGKHVARLTTCHRANQELMDLSRNVNHYDPDSQDDLLERFRISGKDRILASQSKCEWVDAEEGGEERFERVLAEWFAIHYRMSGWIEKVRLLERNWDEALAREVIELLSNAQILTVVREGGQGCAQINRTFKERFRPFVTRSKAELFSGLPILITRNDYGMQLFNGDTGVILNGANGLRAYFPRENGVEGFPLSFLPPFELAFAITIHKSQGSEYNNILLTIPSELTQRTERLLTREIIYTGLTRAKDRAVIYASKGIFHSACARAIRRESGEDLWDFLQS